MDLREELVEALRVSAEAGRRWEATERAAAEAVERAAALRRILTDLTAVCEAAEVEARRLESLDDDAQQAAYDAEDRVERARKALEEAE
jgi:hypothetical protein